MNPVLVTPPTEPVLTLEEAKKQARIFFDDDDDYVETLIMAATAHLDGFHGILGRCIMEQTWEYTRDCWPCGRDMPLLFTDTKSVAITYRDEDGDEQTIADTNYQIRGNCIRFVRDFQYPIAVDGEITIRSTHAAPESLLPAIKLAAKVLVAHWWLNRVPVATNTASMPLPYTFEAIVNPVKVGVYAW